MSFVGKIEQDISSQQINFQSDQKIQPNLCIPYDLRSSQLIPIIDKNGIITGYEPFCDWVKSINTNGRGGT